VSLEEVLMLAYGSQERGLAAEQESLEACGKARDDRRVRACVSWISLKHLEEDD